MEQRTEMPREIGEHAGRERGAAWKGSPFGKVEPEALGQANVDGEYVPSLEYGLGLRFRCGVEGALLRLAVGAQGPIRVHRHGCRPGLRFLFAMRQLLIAPYRFGVSLIGRGKLMRPVALGDEVDIVHGRGLQGGLPSRLPRLGDGLGSQPQVAVRIVLGNGTKM